MLDPSLEIQNDVNRRLLAANLTHVAQRVYSMLPAAPVLPWVQIGDDVIMGDDEAGDFFDCEVSVQISAKSRKQLKEIQSEVVTALTTKLALTRFACHTARYVHSIPATEVDDKETIYHSELSFNYLLQAI